MIPFSQQTTSSDHFAGAGKMIAGSLLGEDHNEKYPMPLQTYLTHMLAIKETGAHTKETSFYNAYLKNIPPVVWDYTIGGYQVIEKWLSYREQPLLVRAITSDEVRKVTAMARRIAALVMLQEKLDANYHAVRAHSYVCANAAAG